MAKNKKVENIVVENEVVVTTTQEEKVVTASKKPIDIAEVLAILKKQAVNISSTDNPTKQITVRKYFEDAMLNGATRDEIIEGLKVAVLAKEVDINARNFVCVEKNFRSQLSKCIGLLKNPKRNSWHNKYDFSEKDGLLKITLKPMTPAQEFTTTE